jgi:O-acetyl-ADP-ribose deacetylase
MLVQFGNCRLEITQGDITRQTVDAIVNAANESLAGGGGVDGAIHQKAGPILMQQTREKYPQGCPTGEVVVTEAGNLQARFVFHAVGPVWRGGHHGEPELLQAVYRNCLELTVEKDCRSIAFPAISTGAYGYPLDLAAETALSVFRDFLIETQRPELVRLVLFDAGSYGAHARVLETMIDR